MASSRTAAAALLLLSLGAAARPVHAVQPLLLGGASVTALSGAAEQPGPNLLEVADASLQQRRQRQPTDGGFVQRSLPSHSVAGGAQASHPAVARPLPSRSGSGSSSAGRATFSASAKAAGAALRLVSGLRSHKRGSVRSSTAGGARRAGNELKQALLGRHGGRQLLQNQGSRRCGSGSGCVIAFSLLLAAAVAFLCCALCCVCCCKRSARPRPNANSLAATAAAQAAAGDPAAAAAEIMEKQLVSKIGDAHHMAGVECPVCLDTPCELVLPCNHGCCHICLDKLITRAARLTLCPMCRERILPPTIEAVVVAEPSSADGSPAAGGSNNETDDASAAGTAYGARRGWRRLLPTPLPAREWVMVVWWREWRQHRQQRRQPSTDQAERPARQYVVGIPVQSGACP